MIFRNLVEGSLLEANQEQTWKTYGKKFLSVTKLEKRYEDPDQKPMVQGFIDGVFKIFIAADPTPSHTYLPWSIRSLINALPNYIEGYLDARTNEFQRSLDSALYSLERWSDNSLAPLLTEYERLKKDGLLPAEMKDINKFSNVAELSRAITPFRSTLTKKQMAKQAPVLYNKDGVKIIKLTSLPVSCHFGTNTSWCTAASDAATHFPNYVGDGKDNNGLFYIEVNGVKYQLYINKDGKFDTLCNAEDNEINTRYLFDVEGLFVRRAFDEVWPGWESRDNTSMGDWYEEEQEEEEPEDAEVTNEYRAKAMGELWGGNPMQWRGVVGMKRPPFSAEFVRHLFDEDILTYQQQSRIENLAQQIANENAY